LLRATSRRPGRLGYRNHPEQLCVPLGTFGGTWQVPPVAAKAGVVKRIPNPCASVCIRGLFAACLGLLSPTSSAQILGDPGSIRGAVLDTSGASIPNASVEVRNPARGISRSAKTGSDGIFEVLALDPAAGYSVTISKPGFAAVERT